MQTKWRGKHQTGQERIKETENWKLNLEELEKCGRVITELLRWMQLQNIFFATRKQEGKVEETGSQAKAVQKKI